jgi:hypothetical protein
MGERRARDGHRSTTDPNRPLSSSASSQPTRSPSQAAGRRGWHRHRPSRSAGSTRHGLHWPLPDPPRRRGSVRRRVPRSRSEVRARRCRRRCSRVRRRPGRRVGRGSGSVRSGRGAAGGAPGTVGQWSRMIAGTHRRPVYRSAAGRGRPIPPGSMMSAGRRQSRRPQRGSRRPMSPTEGRRTAAPPDPSHFRHSYSKDKSQLIRRCRGWKARSAGSPG